MRAVAFLLLVPVLAFADPPALGSDRPLMVPVQEGQILIREKDATKVVTVRGGYYVNDPGYQKLSEAITKFSTDAAACAAENASLKKLTEKELSKPVVSIQTAAIAVGVALLVGAATAYSMSHH